jgi:lysophospholipid acyltransferase (LPLAT)-like uncharacterized protein
VARRHVLPWLIWLLYRLWSWTWRIECLVPEKMQNCVREGERLVFAHWHGHEMCIVPLIPAYHIATMTSTSKDGQLMDYVIRRFGGTTSRGSSTRGGASALKGLVRLMQQGYRASLAVDGPKGPLHQVKPGVFELSRLAEARVIGLGVACGRAFVFRKSWNQALLPKPFTRVVVAFCEPWPVLLRGDNAKNPQLGLNLAGEISKACQRASDHLTSKS